MLGLPVELQHLILEEVRCLSHPLSFIIDSPTLYSLCLVSRFIHDLATLYLYSSITVPTIERLKMVHTTTIAKKGLFRHCQTLVFAQIFVGGQSAYTWLARYIIAAAPSLRRLYVNENVLAYMVRPNATAPASYPELGFKPEKSVEAPCFDHLQRVAMSHTFFHGPGIVDALLQLHRVTHLAICSVNAGSVLIPNDQDYILRIATLVTRATSVERFLLGLNGTVSLEDSEPLAVWADKLRAEISETQSRKVVFLEYGALDGMRRSTWFLDRVADGTLWCMTH
jgi:hypothetical protein